MFLIILCSAYLFSRCLLFVHWETSRKQDAASPITTCQPSLCLNISSGLLVPVHFNSVTVSCKSLVNVVVVVVSAHRGTTRKQGLKLPIIFSFLSLPITILAYFLAIVVFHAGIIVSSVMLRMFLKPQSWWFTQMKFILLITSRLNFFVLIAIGHDFFFFRAKWS